MFIFLVFDLILSVVVYKKTGYHLHRLSLQYQFKIKWKRKVIVFTDIKTFNH